MRGRIFLDCDYLFCALGSSDGTELRVSTCWFGVSFSIVACLFFELVRLLPDVIGLPLLSTCIVWNSEWRGFDERDGGLSSFVWKEPPDVAVAYSGIRERFMQGNGSPYWFVI